MTTITSDPAVLSVSVPNVETPNPPFEFSGTWPGPVLPESLNTPPPTLVWDENLNLKPYVRESLVGKPSKILTSLCPEAED